MQFQPTLKLTHWQAASSYKLYTVGLCVCVVMQRIGELGFQLEALEKRLVEASKAREARLRKAGAAGNDQLQEICLHNDKLASWHGGSIYAVKSGQHLSAAPSMSQHALLRSM